NESLKYQKKYQYIIKINDLNLTDQKPRNSFYELIKGQIEGDSNSTPSQYCDKEITIGSKTWFLHSSILNIRCNQILNEQIISKLSELSLHSSTIILTWIYDGYINITKE